MINPTDEPFFASKSMVLICIGIGAVVFLIVLAVVVKIIWQVDMAAVVGLGVGGVTAHTTGGVVRNTVVDGPTRAANAAVATGITPGQLQTPAAPPTSLAAPPTPPAQ